MQEAYPELNFSRLREIAAQIVETQYSPVARTVTFYPGWGKHSYWLKIDVAIRDDHYESDSLLYQRLEDDCQPLSSSPIRNELLTAWMEKAASLGSAQAFIEKWQIWACLPDDLLPNLFQGNIKYEVLYSKSAFKPTIEEDSVDEKRIDDLIRGLEFRLEGDSEISIRQKGSAPKPFTFESIGFSRPNGKACKAFREILESPANIYSIGKARDFNGSGKKAVLRQEYDRKQKRLKSINKYLIRGLNQQFEFNIPSSYALYELMPDQEPGTYRFKFQIYTSGEESQLSIKAIKDKLEASIEAWRGDSSGANESLAKDMVSEALAHGSIDRDEAKALLEMLSRPPSPETWEEMDRTEYQ